VKRKDEACLPGYDVASSIPTLSNIVGSFKSAVSKYANKNGLIDFACQPRFYDRIIRNEKELYKIRKYTEQNPLRWELEKNTPENLDLKTCLPTGSIISKNLNKNETISESKIRLYVERINIITIFIIVQIHPTLYLYIQK
jgi:hypothetical protein